MGEEFERRLDEIIKGYQRLFYKQENGLISEEEYFEEIEILDKLNTEFSIEFGV